LSACQHFSFHIDVRLLCEIFIIGVLLWLTWDKSIRDRIGGLTGRPVQVQQTPAVEPSQSGPITRYVERPQPTASGQWMWDPAHHSVLDRPAYESKDKSQRYFDAEGRSYWYDAQGVRHYDR
jgi:hypothetical protein